MTLYIVKNGVPWDVAIGLDDTERAAFMIAIGNMESAAKYDYDKMQWVEAPK